MARIIIQHLLLFLLPVALYFGWIAVRRARARSAGHDVPRWEDGPWFWAVTAGILLVVGSLAFLWYLGLDQPDTFYTPPRWEDGQIVPGRTTDDP